MPALTRDFDVIVTGSGPGGAYLSFLLASSGIKTLLIEKKSFPRYKTCGGGLTGRAKKILPFEIKEVVEDETRVAMIGLNGKYLCRIKTQEPMIYMVMRDKFDLLLSSLAQKNGASILFETAFHTFIESKGRIAVSTSKGDFRSNVLVGADGVHSRVRKALDLHPLDATPALEAEVFDKDHEKKYHSTVHFDFGKVPEGYAWIFPKKDHLSIGVFSTRKKCSALKKHLHDYLLEKGLKNAKIASLKGHLIPIGPQRENIFARKNVILLGDAAGLADPVTGEGIYHALKQAEMASGCIKKYLSGDIETLDSYNTLIRNEFVRELKYARHLSYLLYRIPWLSHWALKRKGEKIMGYYLDVITGKRTYGELFLKALNPLNLL